jgi:hypothetical protein
MRVHSMTPHKALGSALVVGVGAQQLSADRTQMQRVSLQLQYIGHWPLVSAAGQWRKARRTTCAILSTSSELLVLVAKRICMQRHQELPNSSIDCWLGAPPFNLGSRFNLPFCAAK